jgi:hypothetical protein
MVTRLYGPTQCGEECIIRIFILAISMYYYNKIDMRRMWHVAHAGEQKCIYTSFGGNNEEKRPDGKLVQVG